MSVSTQHVIEITPTYTLAKPPSPDALTPDGKPLNEAPAAKILNPYRTPWVVVDNPRSRVVDLISRFLYLGMPGDKFNSSGKDYLTKVVSRFIDSGERIELILPAFPFKSPSCHKVFGQLPDYGEELLLRRLDTLAKTIEDYYPPGAVVRIVSDGITYGELLGQSDVVTYRYNKCLRQLAQTIGLTHLTFTRIADVVDPDSPLTPHDMTEEEYIASAPLIRARYFNHTIPHFDLEKALKEDTGILQTYRGYLKFLKFDLEGSPLMEGEDGKPLSGKARDKERRRIAKAMLVNGAIFSELVDRKFPRAVRLSIHAHPNSGPKFALNIFPGGDICSSPWHNVIMERADGSLESRHLRTFDPSTYETVYRYGRPYYIREKSEERDWGEKLNQHVQFHRNHPFGLIIEADERADISFNELPMDKVRALALRYSALVLRGFKGVSRDDFRQKAREFGEIVSWPKFGDILELKENPNLDMNSSLTCEAMPMHYDGIFKTKVDENGIVTHDPPAFQVFQCIHAPTSDQGGPTLLTNTAELVRHGLAGPQKAWLQERTFSAFTPQNKVFGGDELKLPIIMKNPLTGHDILRWHEPWPQYVTKFRPVDVSINGATEEESVRMGSFITDLLYDRRFCYAHKWQTGDFLIADNMEMMHTRTAFKPCPRELWRIHVD